MIQRWGYLYRDRGIDTGLYIVTILVPRVIIDSNSTLTLMIQGWGVDTEVGVLIQGWGC